MIIQTIISYDERIDNVYLLYILFDRIRMMEFYILIY